MKDTYQAIYRRARQYWDTRFNDIHMPHAYEQALKLLAAHREADPDVVLPAVLLHDVGWKSIPEDQQLRAFGVTVQDFSLHRFHETEGARIAGEILDALNFDRERRAKIVQIIDGHDSRKGALSLEDAIVKDADKLWRFTWTSIEIDSMRFKLPVEERVQMLEDRTDEWFFTARAKQLARAAIAEVRATAGH